MVHRKHRKTKRNIWVATAIVLLGIVILSAYLISSKNSKTSGKKEVIVHSSTDERSEFSGEKIYVNSLNNDVTIYIKGSKSGSDKYVGYHIKHNVKEIDKSSSSSNFDVWNLDGVGEYNRTKYDRFPFIRAIVRSGEWDLALKERGSNDFVGGYAHGDEITTGVHFYLDENEIDAGSYIDTEAKIFKVDTTSTIYRDNTITDGTTHPIGTHKKSYTFNNQGLTVDQKVVFNESLSLDKSYLAMLPILRDSDGTQITDSASYNSGELVQDVSKQGFKLKEIESTQAKITGSSSGISAEVKVLSKSTETPTLLFVSNSSLYNKLYFSYIRDGYKLKAGEEWSQTTQYKIDTAN